MLCIALRARGSRKAVAAPGVAAAASAAASCLPIRLMMVMPLTGPPRPQTNTLLCSVPRSDAILVSPGVMSGAFRAARKRLPWQPWFMNSKLKAHQWYWVLKACSFGLASAWHWKEGG